MLALIGAMEEEIAGIVALLTEKETRRIAGSDFITGRYKGQPCLAVQAGIGKVNAALCAQLVIDHYHPDGIINTGVAGSLNPTIAIGDLVFSRDCAEHDMDVSALGYQPGLVPGCQSPFYQADPALLSLAKEAVRSALPGLCFHEGRVLSGDQFIGSGQKRAALRETFGGDCCEMEGAAIAHVCHCNKVPFLIVRAISDSANDSAHVDYKSFEADAIRHSVALTLAMVEQSSRLS